MSRWHSEAVALDTEAVLTSFSAFLQQSARDGRPYAFANDGLVALHGFTSQEHAFADSGDSLQAHPHVLAQSVLNSIHNGNYREHWILLNGFVGSGKSHHVAAMLRQHLSSELVMDIASNTTLHDLVECYTFVARLCTSSRKPWSISSSNAILLTRFSLSRREGGLHCNGLSIRSAALDTSVLSASDGWGFQLLYAIACGVPAHASKFANGIGLLAVREYTYLGEELTAAEEGAFQGLFTKLLTAMQKLGCNGTTTTSICRRFLGILFLGNIRFGTHNDRIIVSSTSQKVSAWAAELLELGDGRALEGIVCVDVASCFEACQTRDRIARALYEAEVHRLLSAMSLTSDDGSSLGATVVLADLPGFRASPANRSLFDFRTNYVLEWFYHCLVTDLVASDQRGSRPDDQGNHGNGSACLSFLCGADDLVQSSAHPHATEGLLSLLEDHTYRFAEHREEVTGTTFAEEVARSFSDNSQCDLAQVERGRISIRHMGSTKPTDYNISDWIEDNRGLSTRNLHRLVEALERGQRGESSTAVTERVRHVRAASVSPILSANVHLQPILRGLAAAERYHICCIQAGANNWEEESVREQLRAYSLAKVIESQQHGYPIHMSIKEFVERFSMLLPHPEMRQYTLARQCQAILEGLEGLSASDYMVGRASVYLRRDNELVMANALKALDDGNDAAVTRSLRQNSVYGALLPRPRGNSAWFEEGRVKRLVQSLSVSLGDEGSVTSEKLPVTATDDVDDAFALTSRVEPVQLAEIQCDVPSQATLVAEAAHALVIASATRRYRRASELSQLLLSLGTATAEEEIIIMDDLQLVMTCEHDEALSLQSTVSRPTKGQAKAEPRSVGAPLAARFVAGGSYANTKRMSELIDYVLEYHDRDPDSPFLPTDVGQELVSLCMERLEHEQNIRHHHQNPMFCVKIVKALSVMWTQSEETSAAHSVLTSSGILDLVSCFIAEPSTNSLLLYTCTLFFSLISAHPSACRWFATGRGLRGVLSLLARFEREAVSPTHEWSAQSEWTCANVTRTLFNITQDPTVLDAIALLSPLQQHFGYDIARALSTLLLTVPDELFRAIAIGCVINLAPLHVVTGQFKQATIVRTLVQLLGSGVPDIILRSGRALAQLHLNYDSSDLDRADGVGEQLVRNLTFCHRYGLDGTFRMCCELIGLLASCEPLRVHIAMCVDHQLLGWLMQGSVISAQALEEAHMWAASHTEHSRLVSECDGRIRTLHMTWTAPSHMA